ncbi:MAG: tRNA (adenosine(37)-N6)-threonylcarbamoyltransferase complex dimerization subunit type 1 TsaB [Candidatus Acidiferrum sp.]
MIVLAIDTCDSRGSVAVLRDDSVLQVVVHDSSEDYSSWLLPAVGRVLGTSGVVMDGVDGYAVAAGPGSFTGVRVGLTTVKAWGEVHRKRIAAVSRLEAIAIQATAGNAYVAAFVDAQREQVFGAVFQRQGENLERLGEEMVIPPGRFIESAAELAKGRNISWVSIDAAVLVSEENWKAREARGEQVESISSVLAPAIGRIGMRELTAGRFTDAPSLDANYVRRSDAEIFWKGAAHGG